MSVCPATTDSLCGCCTGIALETPEFIGNRPALPAIAYRTGRYATFDASMRACLSQSDYQPMGLLRTRDAGDYTLALIDSWAVVLDILTFYQERFANEAYLRTAVDQRSVFELSRLIGYVPSPGVAASTVLAFTLSDAPGSPDNVTIPAGTRVQSVPGPGQTPQVFETSTDITAQIDYNALPAQTTTPWQLYGGDSYTWIKGTNNNISVGDMLLFVQAQNGIPTASGSGDVHAVIAVNTDSNSGNTQITWDAPLNANFPANTYAPDVCIYVLRKKAALYGAQAPNAASLPYSAVRHVKGAPGKPGQDWNFSQYQDNGQINLDASYPGLAYSSSVPQWVVLTTPGGSITYFQVTAVTESNPNLYTLTTKTTRLTLALGAVVATENFASLISHLRPIDVGGYVLEEKKMQLVSMPDYGAIVIDTSMLDQMLAFYVNNTRDTTAYVQSAQLSPIGLPLTIWPGNPGYTMQAGMIAPVSGASLTVVGGQLIVAGQPIGISGKRVRMQVQIGESASFTPRQSSTAPTVADDQVFLIDAYPPPSIGGGMPAWSVITLSGVAGTLAVDDSNMQFLPADKHDAVVSEAALVTTTAVNGDLTTISLDAPLQRIYDASTVNVNANAVDATHGETVQELLGSGDASNPALTFTLKQKPLTYVSSIGNNGTQSTLQVWVNNLQWHEVPNLLAAGPADRVFVTRANANGQTVLQFGDGNNGARTPTGQMNIRAVYRKGIGSAGNVMAGQLSQALDRPQGLKSALNPGAASGGADPATADDARARAPLPTLTLGRVVSLEDYQNYALNFAGIAKAVASWTYFSGRRGVFLTVAGAQGATFQPDDAVMLHLVQSLQTYGNPYVPLQVVSYVPVPFQLAANVHVDTDDYDTTAVLAQVWQNLRDAFAFDRRQLGQRVAASEIVEIVQQTPGVIAMQLTALFVSAFPGGSLPAQLCAAGAQPPLGAQLLQLDPACQHALGVWT